MINIFSLKERYSKRLALISSSTQGRELTLSNQPKPIAKFIVPKNRCSTIISRRIKLQRLRQHLKNSALMTDCVIVVLLCGSRVCDGREAKP